MLDNLVKLVQQYAGDAVVNNNAIPNEKNDSVIQETAGSILQSLQGMSNSGQLGQVVEMFTDKGAGNTLTQNIQGNVVSSLMNKLGISGSTAQNVAAQLVPTVLSALSKNTNDPNNHEFNINSVLSSVTGGKTAGIDVQGMLDKYAGGADGKFDLSDVVNFLNKGKGNSSGNEGGGLLGALGNLLK